MGVSKHYHVLSGLHGCMPDTNTVYATRKHAERGAAWVAGIIRDEGGKLTGSARKSYYEVGNPADVGVEYIEITTCYDDCFDEEE